MGVAMEIIRLTNVNLRNSRNVLGSSKVIPDCKVHEEQVINAQAKEHTHKKEQDKPYQKLTENCLSQVNDAK